MSDDEDHEAVYEEVRGTLRFICETELSRLAPDVSVDEFWAVADKIQAEYKANPHPSENILFRVGRQFEAASAEARARKKADELESMWKMAPKDRGF